MNTNDATTVSEDEVEFTAVRAAGPGGQNVNKVASAIQLRFDIGNSSLPEAVKARLLKRRDQRITSDGWVVLKAQNHRSQEKNRAEALARLQEMVEQARRVPKPRRATKPSRAAKQRRMDQKKKRGQIKSLRGKPVL